MGSFFSNIAETGTTVGLASGAQWIGERGLKTASVAVVGRLGWLGGPIGAAVAGAVVGVTTAYLFDKDFGWQDALVAAGAGALGGLTGGLLGNFLGGAINRGMTQRIAIQNLPNNPLLWPTTAGKIGSALGIGGLTYGGIALRDRWFGDPEDLPVRVLGPVAHAASSFQPPLKSDTPTLPSELTINVPDMNGVYDANHRLAGYPYPDKCKFSKVLQDYHCVDYPLLQKTSWDCLGKGDPESMPEMAPMLAIDSAMRSTGAAVVKYQELVSSLNSRCTDMVEFTRAVCKLVNEAKARPNEARQGLRASSAHIRAKAGAFPPGAMPKETHICEYLDEAANKSLTEIKRIADANGGTKQKIDDLTKSTEDRIRTAEREKTEAERKRLEEQLAKQKTATEDLEKRLREGQGGRDNPALQQQQRDALALLQKQYQDQLAAQKEAAERQLKGAQDAAERRQQELAGRMQDVKEQASRDARVGAGGGNGRGNGGGAEGDASRATQAAMQEMRQQQEQDRVRQQQREDQERMRQQQQDMQRQQLAAQQDRAKEQQARLAQQNANAAQRSPGAAPGTVPSQQAAASNAAKSAASQTVSADPRQDRPPTQPAAAPNPNAGDDLAVVFPDGRVVQVVSTTVKYGLLQELDKKVNNAEAAYQGSPVVMPGTQIGPSELITGCVAKSTTTSLLVVATGSPTSGEPLLAVLDGGLVEFNPDAQQFKQLGTDWKFYRPDKIADAMPVNQQAVPVDTTPDLVS